MMPRRGHHDALRPHDAISPTIKWPHGRTVMTRLLERFVEFVIMWFGLGFSTEPLAFKLCMCHLRLSQSREKVQYNMSKSCHCFMAQSSMGYKNQSKISGMRVLQQKQENQNPESPI
jgi:hypothetical protein